MTLDQGLIELAFVIEVTPENAAFLAEMQARAEAGWPLTLTRIQEQSRLSGLEVVYDLSTVGERWSPVFRHDNDRPVAWVNNVERRDGPDHPEGMAFR